MFFEDRLNFFAASHHSLSDPKDSAGAVLLFFYALTPAEKFDLD